MSANINHDALRKGFEAQLQLVKTAVTNGDVLWNNTLGLFGQHGSGRKLISDGLQWVGGEMGKGAVRGGGEQIRDSIGWDASKSFGQNATGMAQKAFGWDTSKGFMDNIQANPIKSGLLGAGVLAGGYTLGKSFGLWGNGENQEQNNPAQKHFSNPYTNMPNAPQALQKASELRLPQNLTLPEPELRLPSVLTPSVALTKGIYDLVNAGAPEEPIQRKLEIMPDGPKAEKALANPRMQQYVTSLLRETYSK